MTLGMLIKVYNSITIKFSIFFIFIILLTTEFLRQQTWEEFSWRQPPLSEAIRNNSFLSGNFCSMITQPEYGQSSWKKVEGWFKYSNHNFSLLKHNQVSSIKQSDAEEKWKVCEQSFWGLWERQSWSDQREDSWSKSQSGAQMPGGQGGYFDENMGGNKRF